MNKTTKYNILIKGLNIHHVLSFFENEKIYASNLIRHNNKSLSCTLTKTDYIKFKKSHLYNLYQVKIIKISSPLNFFRFILNKLGLIIGITICLITTINFTGKIHSVELNDTNHSCTNQQDCIFSSSNKEKLQNVLLENNISVGQPLSNLPTNLELERIIVKEFKQVSGVKLTQHGVNISIEIQEAKLLYPEKTNQLVAEKNGIVVSVNVTCGKALVKPGDIVLKNQVLVEPTNNEQIVASVVLRTFYNESIIYNEQQTSYQRTGKTITQNNISLLNLNLSSNSKNTFELYECETRSRFAFLNLFLPVKINENIYYELEQHENIIPFENIEQTLKEELKNKTIPQIPTNADIKNITYTIHTEGSRTLLSCYIETYLTIST